MNPSPYDRDEHERLRERWAAAQEAKDAALRFGEGDYIVKPKEDLEAMRKRKEIEKLWRHEEWKP